MSESEQREAALKAAKALRALAGDGAARTMTNGEGCLFLLVVFAWLPLAIVLRGIAAKILWGWFMVPFGMRAVTAAQMIGLSCVISIFIDQRKSGLADKKITADESWRAMARLIGYGVGIPLLALFEGWVVKHWL